MSCWVLTTPAACPSHIGAPTVQTGHRKLEPLGRGSESIDHSHPRVVDDRGLRSCGGSGLIATSADVAAATGQYTAEEDRGCDGPQEPPWQRCRSRPCWPAPH